MKSAEVYDVVKNQWKNLPDMPEKYFGITCVRLQNQILMCSWEFRLISYDIDNEAYSFVALQENGNVTIAYSKEKIYLFEGKQILKMTKKCEVLETITTNGNLWECAHSLTNKDGIIFLLMADGKVNCFDPFRKKKELTLVQDLRLD